MSEAMAFTYRMTGWPASSRHTATWRLPPLLEIWIPKSRTFFYSILVLDLKWIKWETTGLANRRLRQNQLQRDECGHEKRATPHTSPPKPGNSCMGNLDSKTHL